MTTMTKPAVHSSDIILGIMAGISLSLGTVALSTLVFSGPLAEFLPLFMAVMLLGCAISVFLTAWRSGIPTMLSAVQAAPAALTGAITASLVTAAVFVDDRSGLLSTALAAVVMGTLGVAITATLFWYCRLTRLAQFLPYPVTCGFLAGVGWLILNSSVRVVSGYSLTLETLDDIFLSEAIWRLLAMLVAGFSIFFLARRFPNPLTTPIAIVLIVFVFYCVTLIMDQDLATLRSEGWVFGPFASGGLESGLQALSLQAINWSLILQHSGSIAVVILVSLVSMLVYLTGIEVALRREINIDHELKIVSLGCLVNACLGAITTFPSAPLSILFGKLGAVTRLLGFSAGTVVLIAAIVGPSALNYMPKVAFAALLFFIALGLLIEWLWRSYARLSRAEYIILLIIFLTVVVSGFLEAVALGVLVCAIFFVLKYSTLSLTKTEADGTTLRSDVDRSGAELKLLDQEGGRLLIFRLEGYLFFGTASLLLNRIRAKVETLANRPAYIVLGLHDVSGMDSSAMFAFVKLRQLVERENMILILTEVDHNLLDQFRIGEVIQDANDHHVRVFGETDFGIEWAEEQLLKQSGISKIIQPIAETLTGLMRDDAKAAELAQYLQKLEIKEGQYLYRLGEEGRDIYFIESGTISIMIPLDSGGELRLRKLGPGTVAGELDFYDGTPRDADALVTEACVLWQLSAQKLEQLMHEAPQEAAMFHAMMARAMSRRVGQLSDELRTVVS